MRKLILVIFAFLVYTNALNAQENTFYNRDIGVGMGVNYGGFGTSVAYAFTPYISIEGNLGYNLLDIVGGGALNIHLVPKNNKKFYCLTLKGMYGYNAGIITSKEIELTGNSGKSFYGISFGLINEFRFGSKKDIGINIGIIIPIRSAKFTNSYNGFTESGYDLSTAFPVLLSIGLHVEDAR